MNDAIQNKHIEVEPGVNGKQIDWKSIAVATVILGLISAVFYIPTRITFSIATLSGIVVLVRKLYGDNRAILAGSGFRSVLKTIPFALLVSLPYALALIPGFIVSFALDIVLNAAVTTLDKVIAPKVESTFVTFTEPWPIYDPRGWIGNGAKKSIREVQVLVNAPFYIRMVAGTLRQCLELMHCYLYVYIAFVSVRVFCFFFARVFVTRGGRIVFCLAGKQQ